MASTQGQSGADPLGAIADELHTLGAESQTERAVKQTVPWVASVGLHAGIFVIAILVAGTVSSLIKDTEVPLIIADFDAMTYDPVSQLDVSQSEVDPEVVPDKMQPDVVEQTVTDKLAELAIDPISLISNAASESPMAQFAPRPVEGGATFVGLKTSNARQIVYVIDASGSLLGTLQVVIQELGRSLEALSSQQEFSVIFFQQDRAMAAPPGRLLTATEDEKLRALRWINNAVIPSGNSNPVPALELALKMEPDVIFLLSDNITGAGQYEIDRQDLMKMLDERNPRDKSSGRRRTAINCIQFLDPDPLDTLALIAREHGGPDGYKFLDREELGLTRP